MPSRSDSLVIYVLLSTVVFVEGINLATLDTSERFCSFSYKKGS